jgi:hypothetical protein
MELIFLKQQLNFKYNFNKIQASEHLVYFHIKNNRKSSYYTQQQQKKIVVRITTDEREKTWIIKNWRKLCNARLHNL